MSLDTLKNDLPEYAKDLKLNLSSLARETELDEQKKWGTFLASAHAVGEPKLLAAIKAEADAHLSTEAINGAKAASAIMGMNNVYYRFIHLSKNKEYGSLPAKLRMNIIANPGVDKADFELWSLAVSAINGCGLCIDSHEAELRKHGLSTTQIQTAVRIAATVNAVAAVLSAES
ncbi:alkyl hydroperoxide reductase [Maricaulis sp. W15]|uniref:Alkyl hydroperoxide reductase AhpD n=1 Tax=Maricaulis maris TaxID=74318 RepID=A0A495D423_9PROT|nr:MULTISPECIES: carboxymuconolactone decarboxylase family protein [Maricaulis]OLF75369.1 alkyl hydroperoxide reductase [Maricaulis sp. W15]RKQ96657.1 alkyl hydroperoxide reductase subunit D [Maricaulis maris]